MTRYDVDFHAWASEQAEALTRRSSNELDWDMLAEELRNLAGSEVRELYHRYVVLLLHLLKWKFQPQGRGRSWRNSVVIQRKELARHLKQNPSLKAVEEEEFESAYETARLHASSETELPVETFPDAPPFTKEQAKAETFWPGGEDEDEDEVRA